MKIYLKDEYVGSDLLWTYYINASGETLLECLETLKVSKKGPLGTFEYHDEGDSISSEIYAIILQTIADCLALESDIRQWRP